MENADQGTVKFRDLSSIFTKCSPNTRTKDQLGRGLTNVREDYEDMCAIGVRVDRRHKQITTVVFSQASLFHKGF